MSLYYPIHIHITHSFIILSGRGHAHVRADAGLLGAPGVRQFPTFICMPILLVNRKKRLYKNTPFLVLFFKTVWPTRRYVMVAALKHIRRRTSDKCMHVFLLSMTAADFLLTGFISHPQLAYHIIYLDGLIDLILISLGS